MRDCRERKVSASLPRPRGKEIELKTKSDNNAGRVRPIWLESKLRGQAFPADFRFFQGMLLERRILFRPAKGLVDVEVLVRQLGIGKIRRCQNYLLIGKFFQKIGVRCFRKSIDDWNAGRSRGGAPPKKRNTANAQAQNEGTEKNKSFAKGEGERR